MLYSENAEQLKEWIPLVMEGRDNTEKVAATRMDIGTDVNFGALTRKLFRYLSTTQTLNFILHMRCMILTRTKTHHWKIKVKNLTTGKKEPLPPGSYSLVPAAAHCRYLKTQGYLKARDMADSR